MNSKAGRSQVEAGSTVQQEQFNISHAVDFSFPVPPIAEQGAIVAYIDEEQQG